MIEAFHQQNPYGLDRMEKGRMLTEELKELTGFTRNTVRNMQIFWAW